MKVRMNHAAIVISVAALIAAILGWRNTTILAEEAAIGESHATQRLSQTLVVRVDELEQENAELRQELEKARSDLRGMEVASEQTVARVEATSKQIEALETSVEESKQRGIQMRTSLSSIERKLSNREAETSEEPRLEDYVHIDMNPINGLAGPHIIFEGVNVHIRSGSGATDDSGGPLLGLGNLIVGYNEIDASEFKARNGSHNIVVGSNHGYGSFGGLLAGLGNNVSAPFSTVSGGTENEANGWASSVMGGQGNRANGNSSSISGGIENVASADVVSILGGMHGTLSDDGWSRMGTLAVPPS